MRFSPFVALAFAGGLLSLGPPLAADPIVVLDNHVPSRSPDAGVLVGQNLQVNESLAENFVLAQTTAITSIQAYMYGGDLPGTLFPGTTFTLTIYSDLNHTPGFPLFSHTFQILDPLDGYQWHGLAGDKLVTLPPGSYWVALASLDDTDQAFIAMYDVAPQYPEVLNYAQATPWIAFENTGQDFASWAIDLRVLGQTAPRTAHLANLSVRSSAGTGAQTLISGFVVQGSGPKNVLVRGDGPALAPFGVSGALPDPVLTLFDGGGTVVSANAAWGGSAAFGNVFAQVGAFPLPPDSKDAALLSLLAPGSYTAHVSSTNGDGGVALIEVYDADAGIPTARFVNLSARSEAGTASQTLIAGFSVGGSGTETVLLRGVGPGLAQFGVSDVLATPQLSLFDSSGALIATNTNWVSPSTRGASGIPATITPAASSLFTQLGAFALAATTPDCALVAVLPPGTYTAQVAGVNNTTGVALVEIYEVP